MSLALSRAAIAAAVLCMAPAAALAQGRSLVEVRAPDATASSASLATGAGAGLNAAAFERALAAYTPEQRQALAQNPEALAQLAQQELLRMSILREAVAQNVASQPRVAALAERAAQTAIIEAHLDKLAEPPASYPSAAEIQKAYQENSAQLVGPETLDVYHIFVGVPQNADAALVEARRARIAELRKRAGTLEQFKAVAREASDDTESAAKGGQLGWLAPAAVGGALGQTLASLQQGQTSEPVRGEGGWHLLRYEGKRPGERVTLEQATPLLKRELRAVEAQRRRQSLFEERAKADPIKVDAAKLKAAADSFIARAPR